MTVLHKYGGVWLDASCFCTAPVEKWISPDPTQLTLFTQRLNSNILENWALAATKVRLCLYKLFTLYFLVEKYISPDPTQLTLFTQRLNSNILENWALAATKVRL